MRYLAELTVGFCAANRSVNPDLFIRPGQPFTQVSNVTLWLQQGDSRNESARQHLSTRSHSSTKPQILIAIIAILHLLALAGCNAGPVDASAAISGKRPPDPPLSQKR